MTRLAILTTLSAFLALPLAIRAEPISGNLDAPDAAGGPLIGWNPNPSIPPGILSVSFTTDGSERIFDKLQLRLKQLPNFTTADPFVSIFGDNGNGLPGPLVVRLEEDRPLVVGTETYTFTASTEVILTANTRYHIVVSNANNGQQGAYGWVDSNPRTDPSGPATFESYRSFNVRTGLWGNPIPPRCKFQIDAVADDDRDGVPNDIDFCPDSILTETVIIDGTDTGVANPVFPDGCTIADLIAQIEDEAKNHGQFVSGVGRLARTLEDAGEISKDDRKALQRAAAQSSIGK